MKFTNIASIIGGVVLTSQKEGLDLRRINTDSRSIQAGDIFLALVGERFDGHAFCEEAFKKGAAMIIGSNKGLLQKLAEKAQTSGSDCSVIQVANTLNAFHKLAQSYRKSLKAKVIFLTGSNGKTSTKEAIKQALLPSLKLSATEKNYNNLIGLPQTILSALPSDDVLLLEAGTSEKGEIAQLCKVAQPDIGILLNIAPAHLEGFKDIDGVLKEKWSMVSELPSGAELLLNADDPLLASRRSVWKKCELFGSSCKGWSVSDCHVTTEGTSFTLHRKGKDVSFHLPLIGEQFITSALAAVAVAERFGITAEHVADRLKTWSSLLQRMSVRRWKNCEVINDAYNANPASMQKGLESLFRIANGTPTYIVLGEMKELGEKELEYHKEVGRSLAKGVQAHSASVWKILLVGEGAKAIQQGALEEHLSEEHFSYAGSLNSAGEILKTACKENEKLRIYLKASNSTELYTLEEEVCA